MVTLHLLEVSGLLLVIQVALASGVAMLLIPLLVDLPHPILLSHGLNGLLPDIVPNVHPLLLLNQVPLLVLHRLHLQHVKLF